MTRYRFQIDFGRSHQPREGGVSRRTPSPHVSKIFTPVSEKSNQAAHWIAVRFKWATNLFHWQYAHRFGKSILRLVELSNGSQVIIASAGQVLFGENVFQNDSNTELLSLLGQT